MKNAISFLFMWLIISATTSDLKAQCDIPYSQTSLFANRMISILPQGGDLFWDGSDAGYGFAYNDPVAPEVRTIFAGGLWMGGFTPSSDLRLAATQYGMASGETDYYPGPLDADGMTNETNCNNWDRHWQIFNSEIDEFLADWADGTLDNQIPDNVLIWPGRGNPHVEDIWGFEIPTLSYEFAPFHDENSDGIYNPEDGDYPDVNGADQAIYWVFNDAGGAHNESGGEPLHTEVHALAYAYASTDETINQTTFYDLRTIYKGVEPLSDSYMSLWIDADLGCYTDDYLGCIPDQNMAYVYNQDAQDGQSGCACPGGVLTFCEEIPVVGIKMLKGVTAGRIINDDGEYEIPGPGETPDAFVDIGLTNFMYHNNGGEIPPPPPGTDDPSSPIEFYHYMTSRFRDGIDLSAGGDGYNLGGLGTNYAFPDSPDEAGGWSMCAENLGARDRRMILSSGPYVNQPGAINNITFAIIHVSDVPHPCPSMDALSDAGDMVEDFYNENVLNVSTQDLTTKNANVKAVPNPFSEMTELQFSDLNGEVSSITLFSVTGEIVRAYPSVAGDQLTIEKGNLNSGMYFYQIKTRNNQQLSGKLIVH